MGVLKQLKQKKGGGDLSGERGRNRRESGPSSGTCPGECVVGRGNQERQGDWTKYGRSEGEETTGQRKERQIGKGRDVKTGWDRDKRR